MAKSMAAATATAALSQVVRDIDLGAVIADRKRLDRSPSLNTYILAATAQALPLHPFLNGRLDDDNRTVHLHQRVNLGVAVATDDGLIVPVVHGADQLGFDALGAAVAALANKARTGGLTIDDVSAGTFTVSNLGMFGIDSGFAIPPPPQGAILLVGRAKPTFVPGDEGQPVVRTDARFGLTFDHRFIDGVTAAALLGALDSALADPVRLRGAEA